MCWNAFHRYDDIQLCWHFCKIKSQLFTVQSSFHYFPFILPPKTFILSCALPLCLLFSPRCSPFKHYSRLRKVYFILTFFHLLHNNLPSLLPPADVPSSWTSPLLFTAPSSSSSSSRPITHSSIITAGHSSSIQPFLWFDHPSLAALVYVCLPCCLLAALCVLGLFSFNLLARFFSYSFCFYPFHVNAQCLLFFLFFCFYFLALEADHILFPKSSK